MNPSLALTLYLSLGLAMTLLRRSQGMSFWDALFCGVFWPLELLRRGIELLVRRMFQANGHGEWRHHESCMSHAMPVALTPSPSPACGRGEHRASLTRRSH